MSFGGDPSLSHETQERKVKQWLWQIREDAKREQWRLELTPVLAREHFHVEALEKQEEVQEDGYRIVRAGKVLALAAFWTGNEANAARQRIVAGDMIAHIQQCFGEHCGPTQEDDDGVSV